MAKVQISWNKKKYFEHLAKIFLPKTEPFIA